MRPSQITRVVLWMTAALLSFSGLAVSIRMLAATLSIFETLALRSAFGLAILLTLGAFQPQLRQAISLARLRVHLLRNVTHFIAQYIWAVSLTLLPLATVFALEFTVPAHTALLAALFLGERLTPSRIGVVLFGFLGVLLILRPGMESFRPEAMLVLVAAVGFAVAMIFLKKLTATESSYAVVFWMNAIQLPLALAGSDPAAFLRLGVENWLPLLGLGICGLSAHYCLTNAFHAGDATIVVPLDFMRIPLIAVIGWGLYGEPLDPLVFVGTGLIVVGVLWNLHAEATADSVTTPAKALPDE